MLNKLKAQADAPLDVGRAHGDGSSGDGVVRLLRPLPPPPPLSPLDRKQLGEEVEEADRDDHDVEEGVVVEVEREGTLALLFVRSAAHLDEDEVDDTTYSKEKRSREMQFEIDSVLVKSGLRFFFDVISITVFVGDPASLDSRPVVGGSDHEEADDGTQVGEDEGDENAPRVSGMRHHGETMDEGTAAQKSRRRPKAQALPPRKLHRLFFDEYLLSDEQKTEYSERGKRRSHSPNDQPCPIVLPSLVVFNLLQKLVHKPADQS